MSHNSRHIIAYNYFGGKFTFLDEIFQLFPPESKFDHLIDLFMGSGAVSLNYAHGRNLIVTANDIYDDIVNFFEVLRDHEDRLIELLELTPCATSEYNNCWERSNDKIEQARRFYVRVRQSFFGLGAQRKNKGWHMAKKHANSNGGEVVSRWNNAIYKLRAVADVLRRTFQVTNFSYEVCIDKIDYPKAFFYADPPYSLRSRASKNDYKFEFTDADHEKLAERLHNIEGLAMVSGYDCSLMNSLYKDFNKFYLKPKKNNIRSSKVQEVLFCNYEPTGSFRKRRRKMGETNIQGVMNLKEVKS